MRIFRIPMKLKQFHKLSQHIKWEKRKTQKMRKIFNVYGDKLQNFAHNKQTIFLHKVKIYVYHSCTLRLLLYVDGENNNKKFNLRHFFMCWEFFL